MTPESLDALLSRACALGATLGYVLERMNGKIPAIVVWNDEGRKTVCGPWHSLMECSYKWAEYYRWTVFDFEIHREGQQIVVLHIKKYERSDSNGEGKKEP